MHISVKVRLDLDVLLPKLCVCVVKEFGQYDVWPIKCPCVFTMANTL